jgi:hypothetical protein
LILGLLLPVAIHAQDIEQVLRSKPVEANGFVNLQQMFNRSASEQSYNYILTGNLNLKLFDVIDAPFQMLFSNMGNRYTQPTFNQAAVHPKYKWAQLHIGRIAVNWTPQTVSGHVFQGIATDLLPGKWSISALYGRFQRAIVPLLDSVSSGVMPTFKRMGYGLKVGHRNKKTQIDAMYFHAVDDTNSINQLVHGELKPLSNHVAGLSLNQAMFQKLMWQAAWHQSFMKADLRSNDKAALRSHYRTMLAWQGNKNQWNITYEYTDPDYRTLGAYYFNNDLENISLGGNLNLLKGKVNVSGQAGLQRDNLDNRKNASMRRQAYSIQAQFRLGKSGMFSGSWSSFRSFTNARPFTDFLQPNNPMLAWDTLNFREISESGNMQLMLPLPHWGKWQGSFTGNGLWQRNAGAPGSSSDFYNGAMGYVARHNVSGASLSMQVNASQNMAGELQVRSLGPVFSCILPLMNKKLKTAFSWSRIVSEMESKVNVVSNSRFQLSRQWKTQSLQAMFQVQQSQGRGFMQATVGYQVVVK